MDIINPPQSPLEPLYGDVISADIAKQYKLFPIEWQSVRSDSRWFIITEISISQSSTPQSVFLSLKARASYSLKGPEKNSEAYSCWAPCRKPQTTRSQSLQQERVLIADLSIGFHSMELSLRSQETETE